MIQSGWFYINSDVIFLTEWDLGLVVANQKADKVTYEAVCGTVCVYYTLYIIQCQPQDEL